MNFTKFSPDFQRFSNPKQIFLPGPVVPLLLTIRSPFFDIVFILTEDLFF